jgi:hypothetical protein
MPVAALAPYRLDLPFVRIYLLDPPTTEVEEAGRQHRLAAEAREYFDLLHGRLKRLGNVESYEGKGSAFPFTRPKNHSHSNK